MARPSMIAQIRKKRVMRNQKKSSYLFDNRHTRYHLDWRYLRPVLRPVEYIDAIW